MARTTITLLRAAERALRDLAQPNVYADTGLFVTGHCLLCRGPRRHYKRCLITRIKTTLDERNLLEKPPRVIWGPVLRNVR